MSTQNGVDPTPTPSTPSAISPKLVTLIATGVGALLGLLANKVPFIAHVLDVISAALQ